MKPDNTHSAVWRRLLAAGTAVCFALQPTLALALPAGGVVSGGSAVITGDAGSTTITQTSGRAIIDWNSFDVGQGEAVRYAQPDASSIAFNRIHDSKVSTIDGSLTANGNVWFSNAHGMVFGNHANVNVGGLVATTADMDNGRFMAGDFRFDIPGDANGIIYNAGRIKVADGGLVALVAPNVINDGVIVAKLGKAQLGSGETFTVDPYGDGLINLAVTNRVKKQLVSNSGVINADGGQVLLTAAAGKDTVDSLINMDGLIQARSVGNKQGTITLYAEGSNAVKGNVAANKGRKTGASTVLVSGALDASGRKAGERGGKITVTGDNVALLKGAFIDASGAEGLSGTTAAKAKSAYREGSAGGDIRIGGDYLGGGDTSAAKNLYVDAGALILNDALHSGDAGRTIFWSDGTTQFYGNVYARALGGLPVDPLTWHATQGDLSPGALAKGDGGFVETSGHGHLDAGGYVDLTASNGTRGTYFLDPTDITIYGNVDPAFVSMDSSINLAANLKLWLDASDTGNVSLSYNALGTTATGTSGTNTITVSANTNLAVGARIRLGAAGAVTAASTLGADTYTISNIAGTTITLSSNLTANYAGSAVYQGYVSQLTDKSGQTNHATQGAAAEMPLWVSNGQNGLGVAQFDGSNDYLFASDNFNYNPMSLYSVFSQTATQTCQNNTCGLLSTDTPSAYGRSLGTVNGANLQVMVDNAFLTKQAITTGTSYIASAIYDGTGINHTVVAYLNGGNASSTTYNAGAPDNNTGLKIGVYNTTGTFYSNAIIAEALIYNTDLSTNAQAIVNQYQSAKWGIALTPPGTGGTEVAQATASDGYSAFTTRYLERLSQSADISLQATNNIALDLKGDTLNFSTSGRSLALTAGNQITTASAGNITTNGGNITLAGTSGIALNHAIGLATSGGNLTFANNTTLGANQSWNTGTGTMTFSGTVNGAHNLTATAGNFSFAGAIGGTTALGAVSLTSANALTLRSIFASTITASTASGNISGAGGLVTSGGAINLTAANDIDFSAMGILTSGGNVTLGGRDVILNTAVNTGTGDFTVNASRDLFITKNDLTTGLVSYYKFDENGGTTANDSAGSNTGALTGGPTYSASNPYGVAGQYSLSFDGVDDFVDTTLDPQSEVGTTFTITMWANSSASGNYRGMAGPHTGAFNGISFGQSVNGAYNFGYGDGTSFGHEVVVPESLNSWEHYAMVLTAGVGMEVFKNGVSVGTDFDGATISQLNNFWIGKSYQAADRYFLGKLDDVRIYNTALSASAIQKLYAPQVSWQTGTTNLNVGRNLSLDIKGDTLATSAGKNLTLTAGNNISNATAGTIAATQNAGAGGNVTMTAAGSGTIDNSLLTITAGGDVNLQSAGAMTLGSATAKTLLARTTGATSDITIPVGRVLSASGAGNALTLASGRNFINNAGAGALVAGAGRWLVYSTDPAQDTVGGLSPAFTRYSSTYAGYAPGSVTESGNGLLYSVASSSGGGGSGGSGSSGGGSSGGSGYTIPSSVTLPSANLISSQQIGGAKGSIIVYASDNALSEAGTEEARQDDAARSTVEYTVVQDNEDRTNAPKILYKPSMKSVLANIARGS